MSFFSVNVWVTYYEELSAYLKATGLTVSKEAKEEIPAVFLHL